ncbi:DUF2877 domain-containing protein [Actinomadura barringtoniae]|uniref:DUF2877 domain-containing protein n=1 Tax=Actinomadura barringtoniae TaxID=1427535 RepID=UPI0027DD86A1|nr:DUF2877 domain-containing protein [Actinomadura barringtoniae]
MSAVVRDPIPLAARPGRRPPVAGAASLALRPLIDSQRRTARVIAVFPSAVYLELRGAAEPRVVALVASDAVRLPNAVVVVAASRERPFQAVREGLEAHVGDGRIELEGMQVRVRRWWDPSPSLGTLSPGALARGIRALESALDTAGGVTGCGLAGHPDPLLLAGHCAAGELADAVEAAERIVGLGPGLTPSGDDILAGLLVSLRLVGGAVRQGGTAVWLASWLGAAVTADANTRTTALAATLLHCAAAGQAGAEVAGVLRAVAGHESPVPAAHRLLAVGHTSGADLAWGVLAGCRATLALANASARDRRVTA